MEPSSVYIPQRAMFIFAHPDDIEFGTAGTAARWVEGGAEVAYVLITSGDVGIADLSLTRAEASATREQEQPPPPAVTGVQKWSLLG